MVYSPYNILQMDLGELDLSQSLLHFFEVNRVGNLEELLEYPMHEWFGFTGFT
jgi:hypothetical protein